MTVMELIYPWAPPGGLSSGLCSPESYFLSLSLDQDGRTEDILGHMRIMDFFFCIPLSLYVLLEVFYSFNQSIL